MEKGYLLRKFHFDRLNSTVSISNYKKTVFSYILCKHREKHLVIERLPWWQNKRYLINFTFHETFMDETIPHKNFKFLRQGSYEITGGRPDPALGIRFRRVNDPLNFLLTSSFMWWVITKRNVDFCWFLKFKCL